MRFLDKTVKLWRLYASIQIVDIFRRDDGLQTGEAVWPIFNIDFLTVSNDPIIAFGISVSIPVMKITIGVKLRG